MGAIPIRGFIAEEENLEEAEFSIQRIGTKRTAWSLNSQRAQTAASGVEALPQQGADLMPRTAVCIEILNDKGAEYRVDTPNRDSHWGFTVKSAKRIKEARFPGHIAQRFIHYMAQSENLLPYVLGEHCAPIAIPAERDDDGAWQIYDEAAIRQMGLTQTARRFRSINDKLAQIGQGKRFSKE